MSTRRSGVILVDEYGALPALVGLPPVQLGSEALALTYSRAYRLSRALLDRGPGRLATRGRFTRLVDALSAADLQLLHERLADPDRSVLSVNGQVVVPAGGHVEVPTLAELWNRPPGGP